jgi:hypothetical protein
MNSAIIKSFVDFWNGIHSFGKDGSIVAALGLLSATLGIYAGVKAIIDKALQTSAGKIEDLKHDVASRDTKLEGLRAKLRASEEHGIFLQNRLVDTALNGFDKETAEGNHSPANERLVAWISREGRYIAELLRHRADWALRHASGEVRATALVAARAYLIGALTLDPSNIETATTLDSVEFLLAEEGWSSRHTAKALNNLDADISESFDVDLFREADEAEIEADKLIEKSRWRLALPLIQRAVFARSTTIGPTAITTLRLRHKEAFLLDRLGHSSKALPIAKETLSKHQQHPDLGPSHPDTLATPYLVAQDSPYAWQKRGGTAHRSGNTLESAATSRHRPVPPRYTRNTTPRRPDSPHAWQKRGGVAHCSGNTLESAATSRHRPVPPRYTRNTTPRRPDFLQAWQE